MNTDLVYWINNQFEKAPAIQPLLGDASFRSYYRVYADIQGGVQTYIAMLAPPAQERTDEFIAIAQHWITEGIPVPQIMAWEPKEGFVLLSDFGDNLLLDQLTTDNVDYFYKKAWELLPFVQRSTIALPPFDEKHIALELSYFKDWFLEKLLSLTLTPEQNAVIENTNTLLIRNCLMQPQVPIHRDYHSRNLMLRHDNSLGVIDFQDAMKGPVTYDLVSLLKDCYVQWPRERVLNWATDFYLLQRTQGKLHEVEPNEFIQWFDLTGLQRHLKVLGIFSRLHIRDNKPRYLADIPRILTYVQEVTRAYPFLAELDALFTEIIQPRLMTALEKVA